MHGSHPFYGYVQTTVDPGSSLVVATAIFGVLLYSFLPCMTSFGGNSKEKHEEDSHESTDVEEISTTHGEDDNLAHPNRLSRMSLSVHVPQETFLNEDEDISDSSQHSSASLSSSILNTVFDSVSYAGSLGHRRKSVSKQSRASIQRALSEPVIPFEFDLASTNNSVLTKMDHDDVSFHDAIDAYNPAHNKKHSTHVEYRTGYHVRRGSRTCYQSSSIMRSFDNLLEIAEWEYETKRICKLAIPFAMQTLLTGFCEVTRIAIIGRFMGTRELSAYVVVGLLLGITATFVSGLQDSLTALCSQSLEVGNEQQVGAFVQVSLAFSLLFSFINIAIWTALVDDTLEWLGFDHETVTIGHDFAIMLLVRELVRSVSMNVHGLLYLIGLDMYSAVVLNLEEVCTTVAVITAAVSRDSSLRIVGLIYVISTSAILVLNLGIIKWKGWFDEFRQGLDGSFALMTFGAVWVMLRTACGFSLSTLLCRKQWSILTFFVSFLGPAEVVAWCVFGSLRSALAAVIRAVADASQARCAFLQAIGEPDRAKLSSYKSIFIGLVFSTVASCCLLIVGTEIPFWITTEPALQNIIVDMVPLFSLGIIAMAMCTMSGTLVGSAGSHERSRLATKVGLAGSWLIAAPLAALFSVALNIDLQGQTAAVTIGCMVSSTVSIYILLQSDWKDLSDKARTLYLSDAVDAAQEQPVDGSSSSSSSSSSSESSCSSSSSSSGSSSSSTGSGAPARRLSFT